MPIRSPSYLHCYQYFFSFSSFLFPSSFSLYSCLLFPTPCLSGLPRSVFLSFLFFFSPSSLSPRWQGRPWHPYTFLLLFFCVFLSFFFLLCPLCISFPFSFFFFLLFLFSSPLPPSYHSLLNSLTNASSKSLKTTFARAPTASLHTRWKPSSTGSKSTSVRYCSGTSLLYLSTTSCVKLFN